MIFQPSAHGSRRRLLHSSLLITSPPGIAIGVVVFSDGGISVQAPTHDREQTLSTVDRLVLGA